MAGERATEAIAGVIAGLGSDDFGREGLAQLNRWVPVSWWSVFKIYDNAPPVMPLTASYMSPDGTLESWQVYRSSLYQRDQTFFAARDQVKYSPRLMVHWHANEIPPAHREPIYQRHQLRERLSLVCSDESGEMLAINLYRREELHPFKDEEFSAIGSAAELLLSCMKKHLQLAKRSTDASATLDVLTRRERDVCERMLKGMTFDGIAADLGVSAGTVKTYRDRAFDKLGIHHRNELFSLLNGQLA